MFIDHFAIMFFPNVKVLRIIGRISFPIFAFMIAEGCKYTKNKLRYFAMIFAMGVIFQIVYYVVEQSLYMCIFITFSTSILMIYALAFFKKQLFKGKSVSLIALALLLFASTVLATYFLNKVLRIDYGFWGCMLPVFASLFHADIKDENQKPLQKIDCNLLSVICLAVGLCIAAYVLKSLQIYSLLALPFLLLYSGERGKCKMKYFFYVFYPAHLVLLYAVQFVMALI